MTGGRGLPRRLGVADVWFDTGRRKTLARLTTNGWVRRAEDGRVVRTRGRCCVPVVWFLDFGGQRPEARATEVPGPVRTGDDVKAPAEIIFEVTEAAEGGFDARALGYSIFTQGDNWADLKAMVKDAVACHFDEGSELKVVRLHFVKDEAIAV